MAVRAPGAGVTAEQDKIYDAPLWDIAATKAGQAAWVVKGSKDRCGSCASFELTDEERGRGYCARREKMERVGFPKRRCKRLTFHGDAIACRFWTIT